MPCAPWISGALELTDFGKADPATVAAQSGCQFGLHKGIGDIWRHGNTSMDSCLVDGWEALGSSLAPHLIGNI